MRPPGVEVARLEPYFISIKSPSHSEAMFVVWGACAATSRVLEDRDAEVLPEDSSGKSRSLAAFRPKG